MSSLNELWSIIEALLVNWKASVKDCTSDAGVRGICMWHLTTYYQFEVNKLERKIHGWNILRIHGSTIEYSCRSSQRKNCKAFHWKENQIQRVVVVHKMDWAPKHLLAIRYTLMRYVEHKNNEKSRQGKQFIKFESKWEQRMSGEEWYGNYGNNKVYNMRNSNFQRWRRELRFFLNSWPSHALDCHK